MTLKPCVECGKECEILPVQLGDIFTLTLIRACSPECMFQIAYEFIREIGEKSQFREKLYQMQYEEDRSVVEVLLDISVENLKPPIDLLLHPVPQCVIDVFSELKIPFNSDNIMAFTRPMSNKKVIDDSGRDL